MVLGEPCFNALRGRGVPGSTTGKFSGSKLQALLQRVPRSMCVSGLDLRETLVARVEGQDMI